MYKTSIALVTALMLAGCGGGGGGGSASTTAATATILELGEMTLLEDGQPMLKIHADGTTEIGQRSGALQPGASSDSLPLTLGPGPTLHADGTIAKETEPRARLNADGTLTAVEGHAAIRGVTVTADTVTVTGGSAGTLSITLSADGAITQTGGTGSPRTMRVEGADTPGKRRAILTLLGLLIAPAGR
jgi:hypothetical protein